VEFQRLLAGKRGCETVEIGIYCEGKKEEHWFVSKLTGHSNVKNDGDGCDGNGTAEGFTISRSSRLLPLTSATPMVAQQVPMSIASAFSNGRVTTEQLYHRVLLDRALVHHCSRGAPRCAYRAWPPGVLGNSQVISGFIQSTSQAPSDNTSRGNCMRVNSRLGRHTVSRSRALRPIRHTKISAQTSVRRHEKQAFPHEES
jgi:hypothetical protein